MDMLAGDTAHGFPHSAKCHHDSVTQHTSLDVGMRVNIPQTHNISNLTAGLRAIEYTRWTDEAAQVAIESTPQRARADSLA